MQKYTQEQLMQYLYGEASPILKLAIDNALKEDTALQKEIKILQRTKKQLEKLEQQSPSEKSIEVVMKHARTPSKKKE